MMKENTAFNSLVKLSIQFLGLVCFDDEMADGIFSIHAGGTPVVMTMSVHFFGPAEISHNLLV